MDIGVWMAVRGVCGMVRKDVGLLAGGRSEVSRFSADTRERAECGDWRLVRQFTPVG